MTKAKLASPVKTDDGDEVTDYTSVIDWKAGPGAGIKPGEFDEFQVSAGPLPEAESMTFKAIQTYSDGRVVSWIEEPATGGAAEPEFPAPTLKLAAPAAEESGITAQTRPAAPAANPDAASKGSVTGSYVLGAAGLLAGLAALVLALTGRRRRQTPAGEPTPVKVSASS